MMVLVLLWSYHGGAPTILVPGFVSVRIMGPQIVYVCDNTCELECSNTFNVVVLKIYL